MSEEILSALVQLFAIFAKQDDGVSVEERNLVMRFLKQTLHQEMVDHYMDQFDTYAGVNKKSGGVKRRSMVSDSTKTLRICAQINKELTHVQKVIVTYNLLEMIAAGGSGISESENDFLVTAIDIFNIKKEEFKVLKSFILSSKLYELDYDDLLLLDSHPLHDKKHSKHLISNQIEGVLGVLRISSADIYLLRYMGPQELQLNGMGIRSHRTYVFPSGSTVRGSKFSTVYFSDVVTEFLKDETPDPLSFVAENITYQFQGGKIGVHELNIAEQSGKLIGVMGASGSGKSTLLNVLNGTAKPTTGSIRINGIDIFENPKAIEGVIGYVPQDDLLMENLTVFQNLYFAAKLCFKNSTEQELTELVDSTIAKLGLTETRNLRVGSVLKKTISGGQRKRVNIALELLREPDVLFVDEPTSGLSSRDSENIMDLLKELSLAGKLVFVVIHQPSSDIFKLFDKLLIMDVGGYPIFYGNPIDSIIYFKQRTNQINAEQGECNYCGNVNPEQIFNIVETRVVNEYGNFTHQRKKTPKDWYQTFKENIKAPKIKEVKDKINVKLKIPNLFSQVKIFTARDVISKVVNKQFLFINFLEAPVLALLLGYIVRYYNASAGNHNYQYAANGNIAAYLFMSIIVALFMGLTVSAEEIINDRRILKREQFLNLSWFSYLLSKVGILFTMSAIQTLTYVLIGNTILGIKGMYVSYWLMLFSISCFSNLLGLTISSAFRSVVTIYILIPLLLIPQIILSGIVVNFDKLNPALSSVNSVPLIGDMMASRWGFEALAVRQSKDNRYDRLFYDYNKKMAQLDYGKIYLLPHLEKDLNYCVQRLDSKDRGELYAHKLKVLRNEITKLLKKIDGAEFDYMDHLNEDKFDNISSQKTREFINQVKRYYIKSYNDVLEQKQHYQSELVGKGVKIQELKRNYHNKDLYDLVKNTNEEVRIFEDEGELLEKVYQIYQDPRAKNLLDYRVQFFLPKKHFMGVYFDTFWFNLLVVWVMTIAAFVALQFKLLARFVNWLEDIRIGQRS